jgi:tyrosyl-tRNA synthetase
MTLDDQLELLTRGAVEVVPREGFAAKLAESQRTGKPLQIKLGLDPTAPEIHIGHAVVLRKLRHFQDLGHQVTIIIGDYTTLIGDPTGRSETRPQLTQEQIAVNAKTYADQYHKILDPSKTYVRFNGEWLEKLLLYDVIRLMAKTTVARLLERDDFNNRFSSGIAIHAHEMLYPICQAYDSVVLESDVEMGGTDQRFNIMMGRDLQREYGFEHPQVGLFMPLLVGLDGSEKMSKSKGNAVGIDEPPLTMFEKLMSISDQSMPQYFELCTDLPMAEVSRLCDARATNPMDAKKRLATEIISLYHGAESAADAGAAWSRIHSQREIPDDVADFQIPGDLLDNGNVRLAALLVAADFAGTNGEAKRLIGQGGVQIDGAKVAADPAISVRIVDGMVLSVGRRKFARLRA